MQLSGRAIHERAGVDVEGFAPPYGRSTDAVRAEIARHYRWSVGTQMRRVDAASDVVRPAADRDVVFPEPGALAALRGARMDALFRAAPRASLAPGGGVNRVGIAVVGAGVAGAMRARTVARTPSARLLVVCDTDREAAGRVAREHRVETAPDFRAAIGTAGVEAVIVSSPVQLHEEMVTAALEAGKHVLSEKPLSNSVESCRRLIEAAARAGRVLAVGFNHRYYPCFRYLKQVVEEGVLGPVDHVRAFGGHEGMSQFRAPWMYERATLGGGAMMDVGIHVSDLVRYLGFEPREVTALATNRVWNLEGSEDNAMVLGADGGGRADRVPGDVDGVEGLPAAGGGVRAGGDGAGVVSAAAQPRGAARRRERRAAAGVAALSAAERAGAGVRVGADGGGRVHGGAVGFSGAAGGAGGLVRERAGRPQGGGVCGGGREKLGRGWNGEG